MLCVFFFVVLLRSLGSNSNQSSKSAHAENRLASQSEPRPAQTADDPTAVTSAPTASNAPPSTLAAVPTTTETTVSQSVAPKSTNAPLSTAQIVARCEPSVALVKGKVSSGTGFLVGYVVVATNAHVIEEEFISNLEVRFPSAPSGNQGPLTAQLLYEDRKRDLAFLAVKSDLPVLRIAPKYAFIKGDDITVIGNPGLGEGVVLENAISHGVMNSKTVIDGMNYHQMSIANEETLHEPESAGRPVRVRHPEAENAAPQSGRIHPG
jgi:S1-C subfamily serine protease